MEKSISAEDPKDTAIEELPDLVLDEILIRLTFTDLDQSRLVSRRWNKRITDRSFVDRVKSKHGIKANICVYGVCLDVVTLTLDPINTQTYAPLSGVCYARIFGSVNGMVLFGDEVDRDLYMINPTNRTLWRIDDVGPETALEFIGFGYNQAESYAIVKVVQNEMENCAYIYSHRAEAWRKKILRKFEHNITHAVGFLCGRLYFRDDDDNLLAYDLSMEDQKVIPLPSELRENALTFGVAREKLPESEQVREVLLICFQKSLTSNLWRLRKEEKVEIFEHIAVWDTITTYLQPLSYMLGDPNKIVLLEDRRAITVFDVVEQSKIEIYRQEEVICNTAAIAFYHTPVPSLKGKVLTIQTTGTKRKERDHTAGSSNKMLKEVKATEFE